MEEPTEREFFAVDGGEIFPIPKYPSFPAATTARKSWKWIIINKLLKAYKKSDFNIY